MIGRLVSWDLPLRHTYRYPLLYIHRLLYYTPMRIIQLIEHLQDVSPERLVVPVQQACVAAGPARPGIPPLPSAAPPPRPLAVGSTGYTGPSRPQDTDPSRRGTPRGGAGRRRKGKGGSSMGWTFMPCRGTRSSRRSSHCGSTACAPSRSLHHPFTTTLKLVGSSPWVKVKALACPHRVNFRQT